MSTPDLNSTTPTAQSGVKNVSTSPGPGELDVRRILEKVSARRMIRRENGNAVHNFEVEPLG